MDFGSCSEAGDVAPMDGFTSSEKRKCEFPNCSFVDVTEFVEVFIELGDFHWDVIGDVLVDIFVSKMLLHALFDVVFAEHDYRSHVLICPDDDEFLFLGRRRRAVFCRHETLGLEYLLNLDCFAMIW